jgi:Rieske 2Fe-2S family protein
VGAPSGCRPPEPAPAAGSEPAPALVVDSRRDLYPGRVQEVADAATSTAAGATPESVRSPAIYVDEQLFEWERRNLFDTSWVCIARSEEMKSPGDQFAEAIGETALLFLRAPDGQLRGFVNVCRHQGTQLLACGEAVNCDVVLCRGHAWTYALDGKLLSAPAYEDGGATLDYDANALNPVATTEWAGMVFANADAAGAGTTFEEHVGELAELLSPFELDRVVVAGWRVYEVPANWKLVLAGVPGPAGEALAATRTGTGAWRFATDGGKVHGTVFPNLSVSAGDGHCLTYLVVPKGARETIVFCDWTFLPEQFEAPGFDPTELVESGDAANQAAWQRAGALHASLDALATAGKDAPDGTIGEVFAALLDERYQAAD